MQRRKDNLKKLDAVIFWYCFIQLSIETTKKQVKKLREKKKETKGKSNKRGGKNGTWQII